MTDGSGRRRGRGQGQRLLYWFRTPPGVRVGRAAIDEQAMRLLEQHNPDVEFDWARLLKDVPHEQSGRREWDRDPRDRDRRERRDGRDQRAASRPRPLDTTAAAVPPAPPPIVHEVNAEAAHERAAAHAEAMMQAEGEGEGEGYEVSEEDEGESLPDPESVAVTHGEPLAADHAEYVEYAEASHAHAHVNHPTASPVEPTAPEARGEPGQGDSAAAVRLGADGLVRLRARYTQLVIRIAEKPMEEDARAELNARAERLNPDAWLTPDEVAAALEQYEAVFESLRGDVGHHPPRRRREKGTL